VKGHGPGQEVLQGQANVKSASTGRFYAVQPEALAVGKSNF